MAGTIGIELTACFAPCCRQYATGCQPTKLSISGRSLQRTLLRGVYYEHWRPSSTPVKHRSRAVFLACIADAFQNDPIVLTSEAVAAAFELLSERIAAGEIDDVRRHLPSDLRVLWSLRSEAAWKATAEGV